jgi:cell wall-associated NlpC family hydrolase
MYRLIACILFIYLLVGCRPIRHVFSLFSSSTNTTLNFSNLEIDQLVKYADRFEGIPYRVGGSDEKGMDCSGLLFRVYVDNNFVIPRSSGQQAQYGLSIPLNKIQKGDWVFFRTNGSSVINHIGLVNNIRGERDVQFIHASTSKGVRSDQLYANYWFKAFDKAIRPFKNISN